MKLPSQKYVFDNRLLAVEELFKHIRRRNFGAAQRELEKLSEADYADNPHELGLYHSLKAESCFFDGNYPRALEHGLRSAKILADLPLNHQYGRVLFVLAKVYHILGDIKNAELRARDSLASYRRAGDADGQVDALNMLAWINSLRGHHPAALDYLKDAVELAADNPRKVKQLTGNIARTRIFLGQWDEAERELADALKYDYEQKEELSQVMNHLSLGYLHFRRRDFAKASRNYDQARKTIERLDLKREKVLYLEYAGEMALEKGDIHRAKSFLSEAYHQGKLLAPDSSMVAQAARRLADAELALDNVDDAMKFAQKSLDVSLQLGERAEVGAAKRTIASVFAARTEFPDALEHIMQAVEILREVADPVELGRTLIVMGEIRLAAEIEGYDKTRVVFDEAARIFKKLKLEYWQAETEFRSGVFACQHLDLATGFKKLSRAERIFSHLQEKARVRAVDHFLNSLSEQAVALSVSGENDFKIFGNVISQKEIKEIQSGQMDEMFGILRKRTNADRVLIFCPEFDESPVISSLPLSLSQANRFAESFKQLLGEEIADSKPTLLLDCRRDPYINNLFPDISDIIASVIVVPFTMSDGCASYLYFDKISRDNTLNPFNQAELNFAVGFSDIIAFKAAELQKMKLLEDNRRLKAQLKEEAVFPNIITKNSEMLDMLAQVRQVVDSNISISIEGETGSGKDLLARTIHYNSNRRDKRFISVNCAALPESLLESELFGYKRGAFTGADRDKPGLFEEAHLGTFFLDEIADMPLNIQAKILRVLEEKELVRLGETTPRKVDVRIISATNRNLKEEIASGNFRQDLYYRLTALTFRLPPLRDRREDIPLLVQHFLKDTGKRMSPESMKYLVAYDWPGNIRELDNEVKKLVLLAGDDDEIGAQILSTKILASEVSDQEEDAGASELDDNPVFDDRYSLYDYLAAHEKRFIVRALIERNGVKKHAASLLNIPESTLRLKIKQYGIDLNNLDAIN